MKKILTFLTVIIVCNTFAQTTNPDSTKKEYLNVIGLDANGFVRQFLNLNTISYYYSPYVLSYKRIIKNTHAIRANVGGNHYKNNSSTNDTINTKNIRSDFFLGIGYENYKYVSKNWNIYYGADLIFNYKNDEQKSNNNLYNSYRSIQSDYAYGVSPVFGVQFLINKRISLATETSYDITYTTTTNERLNVPNSIYNRTTKSTGITTQFHAPTSIIFRVLF